MSFAVITVDHLDVECRSIALRSMNSVEPGLAFELVAHLLEVAATSCIRGTFGTSRMPA